MKKETLAALLLATCTFALPQQLTERNYYADEVVFRRSPFTFGSYGDLKTRWNTILAENVSVVITQKMLDYAEGKALLAKEDKSRLRYILTDEGLEEIPEVPEPPIWKPSDGPEYACGMAEIMNKNFGGGYLQCTGNNLILNHEELYTPTNNNIWMNHFWFPGIHIVEYDGGWSFEKP